MTNPTTAPAPSPYLNTRQAAAYCVINPQTLLRWCAQGVGPRQLRPGVRKAVYRTSDLDAWLAGDKEENVPAQQTAGRTAMPTAPATAA